MNSTLQDLTIAQLIAVGASQHPDAIAIAAQHRPPLTYSCLWAHIQDTVKTFNSMGLGRGDSANADSSASRIAIVLPNGPEMAVAFLSVAACATSAPLNPAYQAPEFDFYLGDLNAKALIVQSGMDSPARAVAEARNIPIIELVPQLSAPAGIFELVGASNVPPVGNALGQSEDVALILHTSGTTSRPKIVPLTPANLCTSAHNIKTTLALGQSDRCLNMMPLFHIHGLVGVLLSSLSAGASVVCTPGFYAPKFFDWLESFRPTWYSAVPTMHQGILARALANREIVAHCPLRLIRSSSAPLPPQVMTELESVFNVPVIESYGMTEAAHQMTSNPLPPRQRKPGSVGIAAGPEVAIMDAAGNLLPPGQIGEVVIRGANVTSGYENNPEANQSAFTKGWFRTGDLGYLDTDGYLFLKGRIKETINRGGEKIFPREVDEVLLENPAVKQVVTFAAPHTLLGEEVAAAVVLKENASATEQEIKEFVAKKLADFKVPRVVVFVDEIPKGPTGKLQRIGLAEKLGLRASDPTAPRPEFVPPRTAIEKQLVNIWSLVLGVEPIGINDNFFQLGGDSVLATQIVNRVLQALNVELSLLFFFEQPTVANMAVIIAQIQAETVASGEVTDLLDELESLSDEEAQQLLDKM
jgi:acyl-CoA synthetase (AMP-forming)/AMP-acid ligase II/acyl carrier protein